MSLLSVLNNARTSLSVTSQQSALVSRNVANSGDPTATRKFANLSSEVIGGLSIQSISQSSDPALYRTLIKSQASLATSDTMATAMDRVRDVIGDVDSPSSPSARIASLKDSLSSLALSPEDSKLQRAAVEAARDLATSLNSATNAVQTMRQDADNDLKQGAKRLNDLLSDLEKSNIKVVSGTTAGKDVTDAVDQRDRIVSDISKLVGVSVRFRANNDLVLSTDSGIVMFETEPRSVEFEPSSVFDPTKSGKEFKIDGVSIGGNSSMAVREGSLVGALRLRDDVGVEVQKSISLVTNTLADKTFSEGGSQSLFLVTAAGTVSIAASVDYRIGGDPSLLRDGNINGGGLATGAGEAGYSKRLNELVGRFSEIHTPSSEQRGTLAELASQSMSSFEGRRSEIRENASYQTVLVNRAQETLSNTTGVNLDEEMSHLLELERSFGAASKLIQTVGDLLDRLIALR